MMNLRRLAGVSVALLAVLSCLSFSCFSAKAEKEWSAGRMSWSLSDDGTLTITAENPSALNNYMNDFDLDSPAPWILDAEGNDHRDRIKKVVLGPGVRNCGECAFGHCKNLTSVEMAADSVILIGGSAFEGCDKLKTVRFSGNLEGVFACAFQDCSSLSSITFPATIATIEDSAVPWRTLQKATFRGTSMPDIENYPDLKPGSLTVVCPAGSEIEAWAIGKGLTVESTALRLPAGLTRIEAGAFRGTAAGAYILSGPVDRIGSEAFAGLTAKRAFVSIPMVLTRENIAGDAFSGSSVTVRCVGSELPGEYFENADVRIVFTGE